MRNPRSYRALLLALVIFALTIGTAYALTWITVFRYGWERGEPYPKNIVLDDCVKKPDRGGKVCQLVASNPPDNSADLLIEGDGTGVGRAHRIRLAIRPMRGVKVSQLDIVHKWCSPRQNKIYRVQVYLDRGNKQLCLLNPTGRYTCLGDVRMPSKRYGRFLLHVAPGGKKFRVAYRRSAWLGFWPLPYDAVPCTDDDNDTHIYSSIYSTSSSARSQRWRIDNLRIEHSD